MLLKTHPLMSATPLSMLAVQSIAESVYSKGNPCVAETYAALDTELQYFLSPQDVVELAASAREQPNGVVRQTVHYPDTRGRLEIREIAHDHAKFSGATFRFSCEGWGLICVYLAVGSPVGINSSISANSEKRALAWATTYPDMAPPSVWNWIAVASHLRRLRGSLRRAGGTRHRAEHVRSA